MNGPKTGEAYSRKKLHEAELKYSYNAAAFQYDLSRLAWKTEMEHAFRMAERVGEELNDVLHHVPVLDSLEKVLDMYYELVDSDERTATLTYFEAIAQIASAREFTALEQQMIERSNQQVAHFLSAQNAKPRVDELRQKLLLFLSGAQQTRPMSDFVEHVERTAWFVETSWATGLNFRLRDWSRDAGTLPELREAGITNVPPVGLRLSYLLNHEDPISSWVSLGLQRSEERWFQVGPDSAITERRGFQFTTLDVRGSMIVERERKKLRFRFLPMSVDFGASINSLHVTQLVNEPGAPQAIRTDDNWFHSWNGFFGFGLGFGYRNIRLRWCGYVHIRASEFEGPNPVYDLESITSSVLSLSVPIGLTSELRYR